jgi:outer membrane protein assembly factor BamB
MKRTFMKAAVKTFTLFLAVAILALGAGMSGSVQAAPAAPSWLPGQPLLAGTQVIAMWLPVPGAVKYIVYLNGKQIAESPANQYMGMAPSGGGEYSYQVASVDASGAASPLSAPGIIRIIVVEPPAAPIFRTNPAEGSVTLRWDRVTGASIYNLYRGEKSGGPYNLVASVTDLVFKDSGLEIGKDYFYAVSVKDMTGKESAKGSEATVRLEEAVEAATDTRKSFKLAMVSSRKTGEVFDLVDPDTGNFISVGKVTALRRGPEGMLHFVDQGDRIIVLNDSFEIDRIVTPAFETPSRRQFWDIAFNSMGDWLITDRNMIYRVDPDNGRVLDTFRPRKPTQKEAPDVYEALVSYKRESSPGLKAITVLSDDRILVADSEGDILHVLTPDGEPEGWVAFFLEGEGEEVRKTRLSNCKDLMALEDGTVLVTQLLGRSVLRLDPDDDWRLIYRLGQFAGKVGNFIGQGGITMTPEKNILVSDPTLGTLQVFDLETGDYLYTISGPDAKPFAGDPSRPLVDFANPNFPAYIKGNSAIVVFPAMQRLFQIRDITGDPKAPIMAGGGT